MDPLVPSHLSYGGVNFPVNVSSLRVGLEKTVEAMEVLRYALEEMVNGDSRDVPLDELSERGFVVQELSAKPIAPTDSIEGLSDGPINWLRLSGSWPDLHDAFFLGSGFLSRDLVVPRAVLMDLVARLRDLRADVLAGKRQPRLDDQPVPPVRPLTPELARYEELRASYPDDAWAYQEELYASRR